MVENVDRMCRRDYHIEYLAKEAFPVDPIYRWSFR